MHQTNEQRIKQNDAAHALAEVTLKLTKYVIRQGLTVEKIEIIKARPVVWVAPCIKCYQLKNAGVFRTEYHPKGRLETWQACLGDCRIQWKRIKHHQTNNTAGELA